VEHNFRGGKAPKKERKKERKKKERKKAKGDKTCATDDEISHSAVE